MFDDVADMNSSTQTEKGDQRVTKVGLVIRRHSFDELPQLFNVLLGQMSMVGPRPHALGTNICGKPLREVSSLYDLRYLVKPGITGWAQVNNCRGILSTPRGLGAPSIL